MKAGPANYAVHYHTLGPQLGASALTRHLAGLSSFNNNNNNVN